MRRRLGQSLAGRRRPMGRRTSPPQGFERELRANATGVGLGRLRALTDLTDLSAIATRVTPPRMATPVVHNRRRRALAGRRSP